MRIGLLVIAALAVLTTVEYIVAVEVDSNLLPILAIAQVKAFLIIWFFMRISRLWLGSEHEA
jgi:hypothetical protein